MTLPHKQGLDPIPVIEPVSGVLPLVRALGKQLGRDPVPEPEPIKTRLYRPRSMYWPPEVAAEMKRIWNTPDPLEVETQSSHPVNDGGTR